MNDESKNVAGPLAAALDTAAAPAVVDRAAFQAELVTLLRSIQSSRPRGSPDPLWRPAL